ncbi:pyridoxamine 5'-phosphate oxidase family protein [Clostridium estertheticum]|uniref:pyridoxamine 5'-phosphate oxidase family protein n=1 Tax=Clostridium estertheticum TaxID=238834 RepID=UPI0013E9900B|nr:pyridoxamine 5'-phosphate oxidase family protein [Clostridium estertheticum]MBZ9685009.1 pyridoxamine 5'-phosphate oxidase family protein [Clostridium estertheticum]
MKIMRRIERQMNDVEVLELLKNTEYGILSTCGEDNQPYGIPLSYVFIDKNIYIHCAGVGSKLDNISVNDKVSFTIVGKTKVLQDQFSTEYESAIIFGRAIMLAEEEKYEPLMEFIRKYSPDFIKEGQLYIDRAKEKTTLIKIEIYSFSGKHRL